MLLDTCTPHQNIKRRKLVLKLKRKILGQVYQYKKLNGSQLNLNKKIIDQSQYNSNDLGAKEDIVRLSLIIVKN